MNESMDRVVADWLREGPEAVRAKGWNARSRRPDASASGLGGPSPKGGSRCN